MKRQLFLYHDSLCLPMLCHETVPVVTGSARIPSTAQVPGLGYHIPGPGRDVWDSRPLFYQIGITPNKVD